MSHRIHTVIVSYNRRELTEQAVTSYLETVTLPYTLTVVDNRSDEVTRAFLRRHAEWREYGLILLDRNYYPGYATNRGWEQAPDGATLLHRSDNDFEFLPGWCDHVLAGFRKKTVGQVGLRTKNEELGIQSNVGGCNVIRRALWDKGLRYDERPWGKTYPPGWTEDTLFGPAVKRLGFTWTRVKQPCLRSLASGDWDDEYYRKSYGVRGIERP